MTGVLGQIRLWAATLPYWEQAALEKVVSGVTCTEQDVEDLLQYLLEDAKLAEPIGERPVLTFPALTGEAETSGEAPKLQQISNLQNVNALVTGQTLRFGPALTAIYGGNGSGKSGYARVLGCAGFTRGDRDVLPDITLASDMKPVLTADIDVMTSLGQKQIHYQVGATCPELASFYVFDTTSVRRHLTESSEVSFSPAGLNYLTQLAVLTDQVRERLHGRIQAAAVPHCFGGWFVGESQVSKLIAELGAETDLGVVQRLANLSQDEKRRERELDLEIARLKIQDKSEELARLSQAREDLEKLLDALTSAATGLSDEAATALMAASSEHRRQRALASELGVKQFETDKVPQVGSGAWYDFIRAAHALAQMAGDSATPYPAKDSCCLLCQQPLDAGARALMHRLWAFLKDETQKALDKATRDLGNRSASLQAIDLSFLDEQTVWHRYLEENDPPLLAEVQAFGSACHARRQRMLVSTTLEGGAELPELPLACLASINAAIERLKTEATRLAAQDWSAKIEELKSEQVELQHRLILSQHLRDVEDYVQRQKWAKQAAKVGGTTAHITKKHNELFDKLVTQRYVELFEGALTELGRPLRVKVKTTGRKGAVVKQIVFGSGEKATKASISPDKVLSEGEKRAVALADFLTEVSLDTRSSGIVLDDPVTSLDLEWRRSVATILAREAKRRQVIVFTHDLPFLYFLKDRCANDQIEMAMHWIKRGDDDNKPGYVFLDNGPALERDYRRPKRARELCDLARKASAQEQERLLRDGLGALRTCYEAFIVFDLFNEVVLRFDERLSFGRLRDIVWDPQIAEDVISSCERLSRYIEGHLHSDTFERPTVKMLDEEIAGFETLRKRLNTLKNP